MTAPYAASHNLLVISDLHLGEDLKPAIESGRLANMELLERQLQSFLDHYRAARRDGRPWELIVNGDMVDFLSVCLFPEEDGGADAAETAANKVWGIGTDAPSARRKMERVFARHPGVFSAFARFLGAGNKLGIVAGNHDVEFHWPEVQDTFKRGVAARWADEPAAQRPGARSVDDVAAAITFHPWFYFKEDLVWIEHGHQYDPYCAFDHFLVPALPHKDAVMLSLGAASYRYISNHVAGADPHQQEDWNALGYLRFSIGLGLRGLWRMAKGYAGMVGHMLGLWRTVAKFKDGVEKRRSAHRARLGELAARWKLKAETLFALDALKKAPLIYNLKQLTMAVMLDRVALFFSTLLVGLVLLLVLPPLGAAIGVVSVVAASVLVGRVLARLRGHTDPNEDMKAVPEKIRGHVRAPFVVFGHSHQPLAVPLAGGGMYFNTGTWVATEKPGLLRSFTHLVIQIAESGPVARLCQWRDGKSREFAP
jgi:UDP-2,3-diacylglucosamine pyrophosphatase LpxH